MTRSCAGASRGRHQRRANRAVVLELLLQAMQAGEEGLERSASQRFVGGACFGRRKRFEPLLFEDALRLVGKQHGIAIEGDLQVIRGIGRAARADQRRRRDAAFQRARHVLGFGGKKQIAAERFGVAIGAAAEEKAARRMSRPCVAMELNTRKPVSAELRDSRMTSTRRQPSSLLMPSSFVTKGNPRTGFQRLVLVLDLIAPVGVQTLLAVDGVRIVQVEQRPRRDGDGQKCLRVRHRGPESARFQLGDGVPQLQLALLQALQLHGIATAAVLQMVNHIVEVAMLRAQFGQPTDDLTLFQRPLRSCFKPNRVGCLACGDRGRIADQAAFARRLPSDAAPR